MMPFKHKKTVIKWSLIMLAAVVVFLLGANHYRMQWWPLDSSMDDLHIDDILPAEDHVKIASVFGSEELTVYNLPIDDEFPSGPFEVLGNKRFLFISKCGQAYFTSVADDEITQDHAPLLLTKEADEDDPKPLVYCKDSSGVKDSLRLNNSLFVAYTVWDEQQNGARLAVSEFGLDVENARIIFKRDIFISHPAIKEPYLGLQAGGKLVVGENDDTLYLSIGDFGKPQGVQDITTSLGKIMKINLKQLKSEVYAIGIRSPSGGLYFDHEAGDLWESEHGPRGGDEINLIREGKNFGWPVVSYGTLYERDGNGDYYGNTFNTHEGFEKPVFTFVPSIGVGAIARYPKSGRNAYWEESFFVAGMATSSLYYIKKEGHRLVYAEPVLSGYRIRAIKIDPSGRFYLKTDHNQLLMSE